MSNSRLRTIEAALLAFLCVGMAAARNQSQRPAPPAGAAATARELMSSTKPGDLVARVVENELRETDEGSYLYRDWRQTPDGSKTKEMIETQAGTVARLIAINDRPLTPEQRAAEDARLQNLLKNPNVQRQRQKEQQQDEDRVRRMFRELPKAFLYQYDGVEPSPWGELIKLKFSPNPDYQPVSRETSVYKAMSGAMWVNAPDLRLARIEATLFRDMSFGWGILGHLDKGGHFFVGQSQVGPRRWEATDMNLQFTGKALLFKTINLRQVEKLSDFRPVPGGLTLAQGIEILNKSENQVAENAPAKPDPPKP